MDTKVNYAAVGVFVIGLGAVLIAAFLWLAAGGEVHRKFDLYQSLSIESVGGLDLNAPVKYRGVEVGKVRDIRLVPDNPQLVQLVYEIDHGTPIKADTVASLATQGLTGIAHVELSGGSPTSPPLVAHTPGEVPIIPTRPSLTARLEQVLTRVLASLDRTSQNINGVFSDENKKALTVALDNVATITQTLANRKDSLDAALRNADRTLANAARVSAELDRTVARIDRAADSFDAMSRRVDQTAAGADRTVTAVGADVQRFTDETVPQLEILMNDLSTLSASLRRLTEQTERNPKSLIFGKTPAPKGPGE
jgi:phospholipid/cholesterol/gamma-HCH transport system substrate-binding protein